MNKDDDNPELAERGWDSFASLAFSGLLLSNPDRCCFDRGRAKTAGPGRAAELTCGISRVASLSRGLSWAVADTGRV